MVDMILKNFDRPDEIRNFDKAKAPFKRIIIRVLFKSCKMNFV